MLEGLFDADRWSTTFQNMGPFWEGFGVTLQVVVAGLLLSLVLMISVLACGASAKTNTKVRIAGLKGPTTMGLVNLLSMEKEGTASNELTPMQQKWSDEHWLLQYDLMFGKGYALSRMGLESIAEGAD